MRNLCIILLLVCAASAHAANTIIDTGHGTLRIIAPGPQGIPGGASQTDPVFYGNMALHAKPSGGGPSAPPILTVDGYVSAAQFYINNVPITPSADEINYLSGATGNIQSQLDNRFISGTGLEVGKAYYMSGAGLALAIGTSASSMPAVCVAVTATKCATSGTYTAYGTIGSGSGPVYTSDTVAGGMTTTPTSISGHFTNKIGVLTAPNTIQIMPSLNVLGL